MTEKGNKDAGIETLRGLAILLVVAYHVNVWAPGHAPGLYEGLKYTLGFIRMPLFMCISGYVYALRPLVPGNGLKFLRGKARRLLLPMVCVGVFSFIFKLSPPYVETPRSILNIWKLLFFPSQQFWFLQSLFLIFVVLAGLESLKWLDNLSSWLLAMGLTLLPAFLLKPADFEFVNIPFSLDGFLFLLPYFLFGLGLCRFKHLRECRWVTAASAALAVVGLTLQILILADKLKISSHKGSLFYLVVSCAFLFLLLKSKWKVRGLAILGNFSYSIFLFHFYAISAVNILLSVSQLTLAPAGLYGVVFLSAIVLSILAHVLFKRYALTRRIFLGLR